MKYYNYPDPRGTEVAEDVDSKNISQYGGGGAGVGVMRVGVDAQTNALDKTWQEISDCFANGGYAYVAMSPVPGMAVSMPITGIGHFDAQYFVDALFVTTKGVQTTTFTCSSPDGYPVSNTDSNN